VVTKGAVLFSTIDFLDRGVDGGGSEDIYLFITITSLTIALMMRRVSIGSTFIPYS